MIDNARLAKAVAALYALTSDDDWRDTDEAIQDAAFGIFDSAVDCHPIDFAVMLVQEGVSINLAADFTQVPAINIERVCKAANIAEKVK